MRRADRLHEIIRLLRDGQVHRADGFARRLGVSVRTIYRDMERLARAGVPVEGARGVGYRLARRVVLPPLTLTGQEVDALNLGLAIVAEAPDPDLRAAALSLVDKLDAALPAETIAEAEAWKAEPDPLADAARGFSQLGLLRSAIRGRQKLRLAGRAQGGAVADHRIRPLRLDSFGRAWILTAWCESHDRFEEFRLDQIERAAALPELFVDEPGRRLCDFEEG
ncbi:helix-turn-helix transcriptional regulator [Jhaorihella thermophila]|uniref:Predicted DNA-binding transcriptional regulator YafY, contains an HTH and WYL domains n=1 Tax=Jhaorihella thermophila TaxID=488547 RepID=A0A1H5S625_9RHOB|nr:HTH domain-containing protein [Jhaorihella thermophila]SEF45880.1 Predicted DNA-binding transcriptional regulator YafY, contains an HTH and WYL domains [Jhaorihella thermophila]